MNAIVPGASAAIEALTLFFVLFLIHQALWALTTASPESLLPAKPLEFVTGVCQVHLCVCYSSHAAKAFMHAAFPEAPVTKQAFLFFCFCLSRPSEHAQHS